MIRILLKMSVSLLILTGCGKELQVKQAEDTNIRTNIETNQTIIKNAEDINKTQTKKPKPKTEVKSKMVEDFVEYTIMSMSQNSKNKDEKKHFIFSLQTVAEKILKEKKRYFKFNFPKEISDLKINTAKKFIEKCSAEDCAIQMENAKNTSLVQIVGYYNKPKDINVYAAEDIIKYLKDNNLHVEETKTFCKATVCLINPGGIISNNILKNMNEMSLKNYINHLKKSKKGNKKKTKPKTLKSITKKPSKTKKEQMAELRREEERLKRKDSVLLKKKLLAKEKAEAEQKKKEEFLKKEREKQLRLKEERKQEILAKEKAQAEQKKKEEAEQKKKEEAEQKKKLSIQKKQEVKSENKSPEKTKAKTLTIQEIMERNKLRILEAQKRRDKN